MSEQTCPKCGERVYAGDSRCLSCGAPLTRPARPVGRASAPKRGLGGTPAPRPGSPPLRDTRKRRRRPRRSSLALAALAKPLLILVALGAVGGGVWLLYQRAESAPEIGKAQLDQLREGMSADEVHAILGNPQTRHTDAGTTRETQVDRVSEAKYFEYFRKGTLMLVFNADQQLIEVCVGEDSSEYYKRKAGEKVLWQSYPATGFIHQDVAQPVFQT